jgi:hypothetical protein
MNKRVSCEMTYFSEYLQEVLTCFLMNDQSIFLVINFYPGNISPISYSKNQIKIQVIYTDLNLIHRFIRFEISETNSNFKLSFKELELKIKNYLEKDKANVIYRLQYNNEALDELNNSNDKNNTSTPLYGTLFQELKNYSILEKIDSNIKSYCLNIVYDPSKNPLMNQLKEELPKNNSLGEKSFIFKLFHE